MVTHYSIDIVVTGCFPLSLNSPEFAPSEFHIIKSWLIFLKENERQVYGQAADFYTEEIKKLQPCLNTNA